MNRRRGPLRIVLLFVHLAVIGGIVFFKLGPIAAKKQAYSKELDTIHQRMSIDHGTAANANEAFQKIPKPQDADFDAMAVSSDRLSKEYSDLLLHASGIEAPNDSRVAHERLLTVLRIDAQIYSNVAKAARDRDKNRMRDAVIDGNRLTQDIGGETQ